MYQHYFVGWNQEEQKKPKDVAQGTDLPSNQQEMLVELLVQAEKALYAEKNKIKKSQTLLKKTQLKISNHKYRFISTYTVST